MAKTKEQKEKALAELKEALKQQKAIVFIDFKNLGASEIFELRKKLKENSCSLRVSKRTLAGLALKEKGIDIDLEKMQGQMAMAFSFEEELLPAKVIYEFSKETEKPEILGGYIENELLTPEQVIELAKLPSKEELFAKLVGSLGSPLYNLQMVLRGPLQRLTFALRAIKN